MNIKERLQPHIVAVHRGDVSGISEIDACMLTYAKAEVARLRDTSGSRVLAEHDHESRIRCAALERLISAVEARQRSE